MAGKPLDPETLREVFVYLYRCWLQKHIGEIPDRLGLSEDDGVLVTDSFTLYFSNKSISKDVADDLARRLRHPLYVFAPQFPSDMIGTTTFAVDRTLPSPLLDILRLIEGHWEWLDAHKERALYRSEAYERLDYGKFAIWKDRAATRIILSPEAQDKYGYVIIRNGSNDFFLKRSKSCKEAGKQITAGAYKRTQHRQEKKSYLNFDLLHDSGEVLLLHLTQAGAGYKAFPRQTPDPRFNNL